MVGAVSRHTHGLRTWLLQRVSAVYLGIFLLYVLVHCLLNGAHSYDQWQAWLTSPLMNIASAGFIIALVPHAWVGVRDVILDYIKPVGARLIILSLSGLLLAGSALWALRALMLAVV
jgi:succinate dehydrogenase / fumarate reductase membrane anchor subunit